MAEENTGDFDEEKEAAEAMEAAKLEANKKEEDNKGEDEKEEEKEEEEKFDEKEEPPTRKSVQDHIIERKNKKIEKLEKKETEEKEEEDNFTPEDKNAIEKEIEKKTAPLENALKAQSDKNDMDSLKIAHPEISKAMEKRVAKYRDHEAYQNIPVENIYLMLAGQKNNLQAKKDAAKEADKENQTGGHTKRAGEKKLPDFQKMSGKEFDEYDKNSGGQF